MYSNDLESRSLNFSFYSLDDLVYNKGERQRARERQREREREIEKDRQTDRKEGWTDRKETDGGCLHRRPASRRPPCPLGDAAWRQRCKRET